MPSTWGIKCFISILSYRQFGSGIINLIEVIEQLVGTPAAYHCCFQKFVPAPDDSFKVKLTA